MKLTNVYKVSLVLAVVMVSIAWADTPYFENVAPTVGVANTGSGNGAAWIDYDNDGDLDLYFVNDPGSGGFYRNNLKETGSATFTSVSVGVTGNGNHLPTADYDGDGNMDVLVGRSGNGILYRNKGDGMFEDVTASSSISLTNSSLPVWGNYSDLDGKPDLYFGEAGRLYKNNGDGTFSDTTSGAFPSSAPSAVAAWIDYDNDSYDDLFLAPPSATLILYHNKGDGTFEDVSALAGINLPCGDGRVAVGDYNGDGYDDIYFFGGASANYLFSNNTDGTFSEFALAAGVKTTAGAGINGGVEFLDFDLDGDLDLFTNGGRYGSNNFFLNNSNGTFTDITELTGLSNTDDTHDIAVGDFNGDGYPDIYEVDFTGYGSSANKLFLNTLSEPQEPPAKPFFDDFGDKGEFGNNWEDFYRQAEFGCEEIYDIDQQVFINRHVLLLKAGQGASGKTTSQVTTYKQWGPKGTFAAYVQFNDPGQNGIFEDINVQDFLAINRDHFNIPEEDYCEVDFEWLTCKYWDGTQADILQLNSWDTKDDEDDNADPNQFPIPVGGLNLDGKWVLLLFQVHDDGNLKFFLDYELLPYPESIDTRFRPDNDMQIELSNWFNNESNDPTERTYTMKADWVYYSSEILCPDEVWEEIKGLRAPECKPSLLIQAICPVDLIVTDPYGFQISKRVNNISGAIYLESDINGDGDPDDVITISEKLLGCYLIKVVPEAGASPTDTFTLVVNRDGTTRVLAQDIQVQDIPDFPFVVTTLDSLSADMEIDPETLNLSSKGNWITCYIQFPEAYYIDNIDFSTILLNGEIPYARLFAGDEQDIEQILMVKFDRSNLQKIIEPGNVDLIVTGELFDGTPFEGMDTIRVIDKGGKK